MTILGCGLLPLLARPLMTGVHPLVPPLRIHSPAMVARAVAEAVAPIGKPYPL